MQAWIDVSLSRLRGQLSGSGEKVPGQRQAHVHSSDFTPSDGIIAVAKLGPPLLPIENRLTTGVTRSEGRTRRPARVLFICGGPKASAILGKHE